MRSLKINRLLPICISILPLKFGVDIQSQTKVSPETKKSNMAIRRPFWKWRCWKSIGSYTYISIVPLKFGVDIQSQTKVRVWKPKNPIWPPGGHFESDVAENQYASAYSHHQHAYEIWNWNSKTNLAYAPETMSSTDGRTDGQTDGRTDGQGESSKPPTPTPHPPPPTSNFVGRGYEYRKYKNILFTCIKTAEENFY